MSFFGFDQSTNLEEEKRKFLEGGTQGAQQEDVAVYTWGEESYDGLGDALQEGGDELNDETFGSGPVGQWRLRFRCIGFINGLIGKDFDFSAHTLPTNDLAGAAISNQHIQHRQQPQPQHQQASPQVHQPRAACMIYQFHHSLQSHHS